jgi:hypothetical protein
VALADCNPSPGERSGGNQHTAGRLAQDGEDLSRERTAEAEPRLDRRAEDDELGAMVGRRLGELAAERALAGADDAAMGRDAVRLGDGGRLVEGETQLVRLAVEVRVERKLLRDDERSDEDDARAAVGGEAAGEIERVVRLLAAQERHDDRPVAHGRGAARKALGAAAEGMDVRPLHRKSW